MAESGLGPDGSTSHGAGHTTVGFLYPGHAAEDDYPAAQQLLGVDVTLAVVHTSVGEDAHRVDALLDLGGAHRLAEGAERLRTQVAATGRRVDALVWACTSGSFVFGPEGARAQADALGLVLGVPASSTSFAFVNAARALGVRRVAVAATYPEDVAQRFVGFLEAGGVDVLSMSSRDIVTAAEVGTLGREDVLDLVAAHDHPDADAVLVPDTALHSVAWLEDLEERVGKPVLTANQVSVWEGLRLASHRRAAPGGLVRGLGALFRVGPFTTVRPH